MSMDWNTVKNWTPEGREAWLKLRTAQTAPPDFDYQAKKAAGRARLTQLRQAKAQPNQRGLWST